MSGSTTTEYCELALTTPAGRITASVEMPTGRVPVLALIPLGRQLASQAQQLEIEALQRDGRSVSCRQGCAACCRRLISLSAPEAFPLRDAVHRWPEADRARLRKRLDRTVAALEGAGLRSKLQALTEASRPISDDELEPLTRTYAALRLPCPFLEAERCTIYEHRPSACRDLLVTSPPEWCEDVAHHPVQSVPVSVRLSTALGRLWDNLRREAPRLIPLPLALEWAEQHEPERTTGGKGLELLDIFLDTLWRLLSQEFSAQEVPVPAQENGRDSEHG